MEVVNRRSSIERCTEFVVSGSLDFGCIYVRSVELATMSVRQFYTTAD